MKNEHGVLLVLNLFGPTILFGFARLPPPSLPIGRERVCQVKFRLVIVIPAINRPDLLMNP
jgi:hypothetical protein